MASFNGFAILEGIGSHEDLFSAIAADVTKAARALALKQLKSKSLTLAAARGIRKALGKKDQFALLIDGMKDAEVKALVAKFDKHLVDIKTATTPAMRDHLRKLVNADLDPSPPAQKSAKPKKAKTKPAAALPLSSEAATAVRKRD